MASKKKKEVPSIFGLFDKKRNEEITQMSKGSKSTQKFLNQTLAPSSREQIASGVIRSGNPTTLSYGNNERYVAQQILAPMSTTTNRPKTSEELFNSLKEQNERNIYEQQAKKEEELKKQVDKERQELGVFSDEEIKELKKSVLLNGKNYDKSIKSISEYKKPGETDLEAIQRIEKESAEYNQNSKTLKELNKIQSGKNSLGYLTKKTGAGMLRGTTGTAQAVLTENALGLKQGSENKTISNILSNINNLDLSRGVNNAAKTALLNFIYKLTRKDGKSLGKKVVDYGLDMAEAPMTPINAYSQLEGMVLPRNSYKKVLELNDKVSEPSKKLDEKLNKESQKYGKATQIAGETLDVVGNMIPSMVATAVTKNPNVGLAAMGVGAKGSSTMEALRNGESLERAAKIGSAKGEIEVGTEMLTGGLKMFGKGTLDDIGENLVGKATKKVAQKSSLKTAKIVNGVLNITKDLGGEIGEETISDVLDTVIDKNTYNPDAKYSFEDWKHTAGITAASTLVLNILTHGAAKRINKTNISDNNINTALADVEKQLNTQFTQEEKAMITDVVSEQINKNVEKVSLSEQLEKQGTKIMEQAIADENSMIENFKTYLEENNIQNPTQQDIDNSVVDLLGYDNEQTADERIKTEQKYNKVIQEYLKEQNNVQNETSNYGNEKVDLHNLNSKKTQQQLSKLKQYFEINEEQLKKIKAQTKNNFSENQSVKIQPIDKVMKLFDGGGERSFNGIRAIAEDIKEMGITEPVYISNETNKIVDGTHRLFVAKQMNLDTIPVKYIDSSNDIDIKDNNWYDRLKKRVSDYENEGKERGIAQTDGTIQSERINENRSNEVVGKRRGYTENNRLYKKTENSNQRLSDETIYGKDSSLGESVEKENSSSSFSNETNQQEKAVKKAIAPLHEEIKALRKEISDIKAPIKEIEHQQKLYEDIENNDVIKASIKYDKKFADKSIDQLQQIKKKLNHTIENPFKTNTEELNDAKLQYQELQKEFAKRGLDINDTSVEDAIRLIEHKAQKKNKSDKSSKQRAPFDWSTFEEVGRKMRAGEDANSIAELNKLDAERENQQTEEQKKLKPKNESTLKKSLTYGQYLFTNRNVEIDNYAKETGNHNIQVLADHINNIQGEITTNINNSQTDNNGNTIGKSITNIFSQADKAGLSEAFNDYLFHLSNIERHKWGKGSQVPGIDSSILIEEYEKTYPEMKKWAKEVNQYNKNLLYNQADAGLITKELADGLSERYEFYVPFMENLEGEYTPDKTNSIKTRSTVKRAKGGSSRNLLGFEEAMIKQTESAITQIRKNQLYQEIVKTKENASVDFENNTNPDIQDNGLFSDNGKYYLTAYVDGKATQVEIDKSLYHGLAQEGNKKIRQAEQKLSPITKPLQATSNIRRNILTTWNPSFMVTNMLKDIQDAPLNSKYANDMIKNYPRALKEISTGKGKHLEAFLNMYGQANLRGDYNLDSGLSDITKLAENSKSSKGMKFSKDLLKKIPQINEMIEMAPRYAEYLASIENGCSQMEALYNAREVTTNFGRGGIVTKALNRNGFTFLNASVQGMSKLVRNFSGENGGRAVMGCIAKATALGIAPALLNALLFGDDDDYEVLPDYIKDNYYLIKVDEWDDKYDKTGNIVKGGGSAFIRIPKGRMMSIFGSAARRTLEGIQGRENPYEGYLSNAYNQVGIQNPSESNIFAPLIQAKNNKTWYGTDLVPKRLQTNKEDGTKIPAKDQYDASTDKMSIWLGEKLNISPYKINYVVDQYSGGIGDIILPMMTEEAQNGSDSTTGKMIAPLKDKFTADSITDNKYVTNFYSKLEELGEKKNATGSKKDEMSYNYMRNISFEMGSLYAEMRKVQADTTLKDSKKYAKVQNIKAEINRLAEEGMKGYKDVETYDNYARVGDRELYKYQSKDGKTGWSDSNGQYAADINNLGLSIKEKNEYYTTKMKISDIWNKYEDYNTSKSLAIKAIKKSKMSDEAKYNLYNASYNKNNKLNIAQEIGISADEFLDYASQTFKADKDKNGKSISGSKKSKVVNYINSMKISKPQKAIMLKLEYNTINDYNDTIINYLNNNSLTYDEEEYILKKLGFEVSKDGTIKWD